MSVSSRSVEGRFGPFARRAPKARPKTARRYQRPKSGPVRQIWIAVRAETIQASRSPCSQQCAKGSLRACSKGRNQRPEGVAAPCSSDGNGLTSIAHVSDLLIFRDQRGKGEGKGKGEGEGL